MGSSIPAENMIPLGKDPIHDAIIRAKLKGSGSDKRKFAQKLRRLKEKPDKTTDEIYELISNPDASAAQIQEMIKEASQMDMKPGEYIQLINTIIRKHSAIFGTKQTNTNLNIDVTANEVIERLKNWKKQEQVVVIGEEKEVKNVN